MNPDDPEKYIRDLEREVGQTPEAAPQPFSTESDGQFGMPFSTPPAPPSGSPTGPFLEGTSPRRFHNVARLASTARGRLIAVCAVAVAVPIAWFLAHYASKTSVHGKPHDD